MRIDSKSAATMAVMAVGLATTMVGTGCQTRLTGNEGNLTFTYTADDDITNFNKPVAVGAKLDVRVLEVGSDRATTVESASFDDEEVLAVEAIDGETVTIEGVGEGSALLEVEARRPDGEVVGDSINMLAAVPEVLKLSHSCAGDGPAAYLVGSQDVKVPFDLERANGQAVIGYGYHPITIEPADGATLDAASRDQARFHLDLGASAGEVVLASTIDDTALTMTLVEEGEIDGIAMNEVSEALRIRVGENNFLHFWPTVGGTRVCQARLEHEVATTTPEVCEVAALDSPDEVSLPHESRYVRLTSLAEGTCEFTVTLPGAAGGQGVSAPFEVAITAAAP